MNDSNGGTSASAPLLARLAAASTEDLGLQEVHRVCALPTNRRLTPEEVEEISRVEVAPDWFMGTAPGAVKPFRLWRQQAEAIMAFDQAGGGFFPLRVGGGKCVAGETEIFDASRGIRTTVAECVGRSLSVPGMDEQGSIRNHDAVSVLSGHKECVRLTLASGHSVVLSKDHPVFTEQGWIEVQHVRDESLVAVARTVSSHTELAVSDDEIKLVAYLMADGGLTHGTHFTNETPEIIAEVEELARRLGVPDVRHKKAGVTSRHKKTDDRGKVSKAETLYLSGLKPLIKKWGIGCKSSEKRLPAPFYGMTPRQIGLFLNRFWACDGYINKNKGFETTLSSEKLIDDIQFLLSRIGIVGRKHYKKSSYFYNGKKIERPAWRIKATGKQDAMIFMSVVGDILGKEKACQELRSYFESTYSNPNVDVIPFGTEEFKGLCDEFGFRGVGGDWKKPRADQPRSTLRKRLSVTSGQRVSRQMFSSWVEETGYQGKYAWLAKNDLAWEKVRSIEPMGVLPVYDLSVPEVKCFVGNGIVLHNTIISFLCAKHAHGPRPYGKEIKRSLLVVPSRGFRKLVEFDVPKLRKIIGFDLPVHALAGQGPKKRLAIAKSGLPGVYASTYALLSRPQAFDELSAINPQLVVCDEAHILANAKTFAATKRRFFKMLEMTRAMFVALSGTMSRRTLLDCWPLIVFALRQNAPVPVQSGVAEFWAQIVDSQSSRPSDDLLRSMIPLVEWAIREVKAGRIFPEEVGGPLTYDTDGVRRAYRVRRNTAPGVVASAEHEVAVNIVIENRPAFKESGIDLEQKKDEEDDAFRERCEEALEEKINFIHASLQAEYPPPLAEDFCPREVFAKREPWEQMICLLWAVTERMRTPNGDEIDYGFHIYSHAYEISSGFYNELVWPTPAELAAEWHIDEPQAESLIKRAKEHRFAVGRFVREMRFFFKREHVVGLDTPLLVWNACARKDKRLPDDLYKKWLAVKAAEFDGMPTRISRAKKLCDYKIRAAIRWAREVEAEHGKHKGGLIWVWHNELMDWAHEIFLQEFGPERVLYCPRGKDREIMDPASGSKFTIASIGAHGDIKDLPHFEHQVFLQVPRAPVVIEQTIGRTHREGQKAEELGIRTLNTLSFCHMNYDALLHDAMWIHQAEARQKIIFADYDPMPKNFPSRFLQERGFKMDRLDQDDALNLVFGKPK